MKRNRKNVGPDGTILKRRNQLVDFWKRFKKRKISVIGLVIILFLIALAVFAEQIRTVHSMSAG